MTDIELVQGTDAWRLARCGSLGASRVADAIARTKSGWGASRANLMAELLSERLTGVPAETYINAAMQRGTEKEPDARAAYEFRFNCDVQQIGLVRHPKIAGAHASPDGLVADTGMIEIKCPNTATHLETLLGGSIAGKYVTQAQWQMACCPERQWVDWVSFDDRLPEHMALFIQRIRRDNVMIADLERQVSEFLSELTDKEHRLRDLYERQADSLLMAG